MLTDDDRRLIEKRTRVVRHLKTAIWLLPAIWVVVCIATALRYPLLANPWKFNAALQDGEVRIRLLESIATMAPILVILVQVLVLVFIVFGLLMLYRERRYLELLRERGGEETE